MPNKGIMEDKKLELNEEEFDTSGGLTINIKCPHCGSTNVVPFHSPSKGTAYLCCDCYRSISIKDLKK